MRLAFGLIEGLMTAEFLARLHANVATLAIGASTLRNQGAPGVVAAARKYLMSVALDDVVVDEPSAFAAKLDDVTERLRIALPRPARHWGAARKAINLFLRDALYNTYLSERFGLASIRTWMEVPLDSLVAAGLRDTLPDTALPMWRGLKRLTPEESSVYQQAALQIAAHYAVARVDLDLWFWTRNGPEA
jgi:hypothetical protein